MIQNEADFEEEVVQYLNKNGKMRREQLIKVLIEAHTQTNEKGDKFVDGGYSKPTINRKLGDMLGSGKIIRLNYHQLKNYGFSEDDGRATYLFTEEGLRLKTHIDEVLKLLASDDEIDKQIALKELNRYSEIYSFDETQLDLIVQNLASKNAELTNKFLTTLKNYIINRGKEPTDKKALLNALKIVLEKHGEPAGKNKVTREVAILLLSHYKDEYVLDQLIKDANALDNPLEVEEDYAHDPSMIADIIIKNPSRLFEAERQLTKEGKYDASQFISNIRGRCMRAFRMNDAEKAEIQKKLEEEL
ncbi:hypothetical protein [Methanohalophilus halophilus]|uniref:Uncharacterized protein n=1 Tax=Methanohalophilus halophilus TaxID=2177 RepID=A0A1L3Q029_9EURY|nr:hypothetical protein [Methanohalophilus halophilus]APH38234.1 hypothetical protein BHR79_01195 [Methanohalophilus halophilus]RNI10899.1 hypothetical protein EFE40_01595 [Methanohalophilus halophilus]SDV99924.1 hypothetical protein SAMN04515625_0061 [Methanohalophilus halophilus]